MSLDKAGFVAVLSIFLFAGITNSQKLQWMNLSYATSVVDSPEDPQLSIKSSDYSIQYRRSDLLKRKDLRTIQIENDPAYSSKSRAYQAVSLKNLFQGLTIKKDSLLQFHCIDGFSAPISLEKLLSDSPTQSVAYIAIEPELEKWPPLNPPVNMQTAGPFYLIWDKPKLSKIAREEWPYQLSGFEIKKSLSETYPHILPGKEFPESSPVKQGFRVFVRDCFACHTLNLEGEAKLGPDLNIPMSPVEYFTPQAIRVLIRNPQDLHHWPLSKMHGFSKDQLSEKEIDNILDYLKHMSKLKVKVP